MAIYEYDESSDTLTIQFIDHTRKARKWESQEIVMGVYLLVPNSQTLIPGMRIQRWEQAWKLKRGLIVENLKGRGVPPELVDAVEDYSPDLMCHDYLGGYKDWPNNENDLARMPDPEGE